MTKISQMTALNALPSGGARIPVIKDGVETNYLYDLGTDMAGRVRHVADRTELAGLDSSIGVIALLREPGREGTFTFSSSNLSVAVTADAQQGVYVAPTTDTTGATGAWVRKFANDLQANWFGLAAANTGAANYTAMAAAIAFHYFSGAPLNVGPGVFNHTGAFTLLGNYFNVEGAGWGETIFKPTGATESFILQGRYSRFARIGCDGRPDGVTKTGTYGIVLRDCNSTFVDRCDTRGFVNDGILIDPAYGGGTAGNNNYSKLVGVSSVLNGGCGCRIVQNTDNNNISFLGVDFSSNTSHGLLAKNAGGYVDTGSHFEGNGGYGVQIGENADVSQNVGWIINGPWIENNTLGGVHGSTKSSANLVIFKVDLAGQIYTGETANSDSVRNQSGALFRVGNTGVDWVTLSSVSGAAFVTAKNTSGTGNVDLRLTAQNSGVIAPQNDLNMASGKVIKVNSVQVIGARVTGWTADTGTAKRTANITYAAGTTLTYSGTYVQAEQTAMATRMAAVEAALQNISQAQKALKDDLITHGLIGT